MPKRRALSALIVATLPLLTGCCEGLRARVTCTPPPNEPACDDASLEGLVDELVAELKAGLRGLLGRS